MSKDQDQWDQLDKLKVIKLLLLLKINLVPEKDLNVFLSCLTLFLLGLDLKLFLQL